MLGNPNSQRITLQELSIWWAIDARLLEAWARRGKIPAVLRAGRGRTATSDIRFKVGDLVPLAGQVSLGEPLLTANQVAELLRVRQREVLRLTIAGDLPVVHVGPDGHKHRRYLRSDVMAVLAALLEADRSSPTTDSPPS